MRYHFDLTIRGTVAETKDDNGQIAQESIDDIRGVVLESIRMDLQSGVEILSHRIEITDMGRE